MHGWRRCAGFDRRYGSGNGNDDGNAVMKAQERMGERSDRCLVRDSSVMRLFLSTCDGRVGGEGILELNGRGLSS